MKIVRCLVPGIHYGVLGVLFDYIPQLAGCNVRLTTFPAIRMVLKDTEFEVLVTETELSVLNTIIKDYA